MDANPKVRLRANGLSDRPIRSEAEARMARQREAEMFYNGPIPDHVRAQILHGDELGADIAACKGLIRWRRQALRRSVGSLRRLSTLDGDTQARVLDQYAERHKEYREAQAELRALLNERWRRRLATLAAE